RRYEVVNGVLYMTPAPSPEHQSVAALILYHLLAHVQLSGRGKVYPAPLDVQLDAKTVVQPDVLVVLNEHLDRVTDICVVGAPDLVIEVVSPSSLVRDLREKLDAYARSAVPEYWVVSPDTKTVQVFVLESTSYRSLGIFQGESAIPSRLLPGLAVTVEQFFML
ncbi:MAG: Uma2 family endonuclease, partial [Ktedonobacteraceae bacterium]|nr:Uma2 family endonuclease [Ktedonobacteraceae bacterium]